MDHSCGGQPLIESLARDFAGSAARHVLHVQSISAWAPSCIGPYSQACSAHGIVFFAGQIGLDPPTMQLVMGGLQAEFARSGFWLHWLQSAAMSHAGLHVSLCCPERACGNLQKQDISGQQVMLQVCQLCCKMPIRLAAGQSR